MRKWLVTLPYLVILGLALVGCSKKDTPTKPEGTNALGQNPVTAPADYVGAVGQAKVHAEKVIDLTSVRQAIQMYYASEGQYPRTLEELVKSGYLPSLPQLPPGYKWEYNPQSGEVRIVKLQ